MAPSVRNTSGIAPQYFLWKVWGVSDKLFHSQPRRSSTLQKKTKILPYSHFSLIIFLWMSFKAESRCLPCKKKPSTINGQNPLEPKSNYQKKDTKIKQNITKHKKTKKHTTVSPSHTKCLLLNFCESFYFSKNGLNVVHVFCTSTATWVSRFHPKNPPGKMEVVWKWIW